MRKLCLIALACAFTGCTRPAPPVIQTTTTTTTVQRPAPATIETHAQMFEPEPPLRVVEADGSTRPAAYAATPVVVMPRPTAAPVAAAPTPGVFVQITVASPTPTPPPAPSVAGAPSPVVFPAETMQDVPLPTDALPFTSPAPNAPTSSTQANPQGLPTDALPGSSPF